MHHYLKRIFWDANNEPLGMSFNDVWDNVSGHDDFCGKGELLSPMRAHHVLQNAEEIWALDALVLPFAQLERHMDKMKNFFNASSQSLQVVNQQILKPFKAHGVKNIATIWTLSDGQTITAMFHNPDVNPDKIDPQDMIVSWKWVLNKKDITIVVAPENGKDLFPRAIARRIMRLADKNSAAFQARQAKNAAEAAEIAQLENNLNAMKTELAQVQAKTEQLREQKAKQQKAQQQAPQTKANSQAEPTATTPPSTQPVANIDQPKAPPQPNISGGQNPNENHTKNSNSEKNSENDKVFSQEEAKDPSLKGYLHRAKDVIMACEALISLNALKKAKEKIKDDPETSDTLQKQINELDHKLKTSLYIKVHTEHSKDLEAVAGKAPSDRLKMYEWEDVAHVFEVNKTKPTQRQALSTSWLPKAYSDTVHSLNHDMVFAAGSIMAQEFELALANGDAFVAPKTNKRKKTRSRNAPALLENQAQQDEPQQDTPFQNEVLEQAELIQGEARQDSAHYYENVEKITLNARQKANNDAIEILKQIRSGELALDALSEAQKQTLAKYTGSGGNLTASDGMKGSAFEYYTPKPIVEAMWALLKEHGFSGGQILDPCAGVGIFGAHAPLNAAVDSVELDQDSGLINEALNEGTGFVTNTMPFEEFASRTPDDMYDAVISNVPFGTHADRGANYLEDERYQNADLQTYFVLRSLEKLKPNGLAAFIVPHGVVSGTKHEGLRIDASYMAEFLGAYRLPNQVFSRTAHADTVTDIIVFRKYSREVLDKIEELKAQNPAVLIEANVQWQSFISGKYFEGEGKNHILGKLTEGGGTTQWDKDRVDIDAHVSVSDVAKLIKKFPNSRVNWDLLNASETEPIIYNEGDTIFQSGRMLQMKGGIWHEMHQDSAREKDAKALLANTIAKVQTPYECFTHDLHDFAKAKDALALLEKTSSFLNIPKWLSILKKTVLQERVQDQAHMWRLIMLGLAMGQVKDQHSGEAFNYLENYQKLSAGVEKWAGLISRLPKLKRKEHQDAIKTLQTHYLGKTKGFSAVWRGDVLSADDGQDVAAMGFDGLRYKAQSHWVDIDAAREVLGADFDPFDVDNNEYVISADGRKIAKADDYFVGSVAEFMEQINQDIENAPNEQVKNKLNAQKLLASSRVNIINVKNLDFDLKNPLVSLEEKLKFLQSNVSPHAKIVFDDDDQPMLDIDIKNAKTDQEKLLNRLGHYLQHGTITLGNVKLEMSDQEALDTLRAMVVQMNTQFNTYVHANKGLMANLEFSANNPSNLFFKKVDDETPLNIVGLNPALKLHGYQNAFVRQQGREFGGGLGDGVGLGKTFQGLAAVQYAQSMGVKKKTIFVVPNSVLSNWQKEAGRAYSDVSDCLFVGLREDKKGKMRVQSKEYDHDLHVIAENRHKKIFMTFEAFQRLRLREDTLDDYKDYLRLNENAFDNNDKKAEAIRNQGYIVGVLDKLKNSQKGSAPFLEDLGVDSIVIDEAHAYKNSLSTYDFESARFLSLAPPSMRGVDAQAKAWFIRSLSKRKDGVLLLTATPITNSPLEVYSMLSLAKGQEYVNASSMGIRGADDFMNLVCQKSYQNVFQIDDKEVIQSAFVGLNNVDILRKNIHGVFTVRNAEDVGAHIVAPEKQELMTQVQLDDQSLALLSVYKRAYRYALDATKRGDRNPELLKDFEQVVDMTGESMDLIAHPFNLLNKMQTLILDSEIGNGFSIYYFEDNEEKQKLAEQVVQAFNNLKVSEIRSKVTKSTAKEAVLKTRTLKDRHGNDKKTEYTVHVMATISDKQNRIGLDSIDHQTQNKFEAIAAQFGLELQVNASPKLAALLDNVKKEQASPRGIDHEGKPSKDVKQIIFCDVLAMHNKVRRTLTQKCGIPADKIAIVTGQSNNTPDEIMAIQEGFNAFGEENQYQIIIANEKAEVGINLQQGTQAIHHLTIGWTPDSLEQRNGRGVRQGNKTVRVNVYYYDAEGTFDVAKRSMVNKKSDWINKILDSNGGGQVDVASQLSPEQLEALLEASGDAQAVARLQEKVAEDEKTARIHEAKAMQMIHVNTIMKNREILEKTILDRYLEVYEQYEKLCSERDKFAKKQGDKAAAMHQKLQAQCLELEEKLNLEKLKNFGYYYRVALGKKSNKGRIKYLKMAFDRDGNHRSLSILNAISSAIAEELAREQEQAQEMIDAAKDAHKKISEHVKGAYTAEQLDLIENEQAFFVNAQTVFDRSIAVYTNDHGEFFNVIRIAKSLKNKKDALYYYGLISGIWFNISGAIEKNLHSDKNFQMLSKEEFFEKIKVISPFDENYDMAVVKAAEIEQFFKENEKPKLPEFSKYIPEIAAALGNTDQIQYDIHDFELPEPYFPIVAANRGYMNGKTRIENTGILEAIKKQLNEVVVLNNDHSAFSIKKQFADTVIPVLCHCDNDYFEKWWEFHSQRIVEFLLKHGLRVVYDLNSKDNDIFLFTVLQYARDLMKPKEAGYKSQIIQVLDNIDQKVKDLNDAHFNAGYVFQEKEAQQLMDAFRAMVALFKPIFDENFKSLIQCKNDHYDGAEEKILFVCSSLKSLLDELHEQYPNILNYNSGINAYSLSIMDIWYKNIQFSASAHNERNKATDYLLKSMPYILKG